MGGAIEIIIHFSVICIEELTSYLKMENFLNGILDDIMSIILSHSFPSIGLFWLV